MRWVGGAHAFHQFHPTADPPVHHLDHILRNAKIFHQRWGWWPTQGWLAAFEARGLIDRAADGCPYRTDACFDDGARTASQRHFGAHRQLGEQASAEAPRS